jgi:hypothetical protein
MARIEGTAKESRKRRRLPRVNLTPLLVVVLFAPIAVLAPSDWLRAICVAVAIAGSWFVGFHDGRADKAREVVLDLGRNDRAA